MYGTKLNAYYNIFVWLVFCTATLFTIFYITLRFGGNFLYA
jgi:hypothetical protein